ncbi:Decaprenyl diphosphate synthase-like protein [Flagelloscypha sp. PMI_526]|nr:Decaprenyl diphosphate synthase-like protein [Flagelloscypha sp. PMI_526]
MDGNRRWARNLGLPVLVGHAQGAYTAAQLRKWWMTSLNGEHSPVAMTVWAFSSENYKRSVDEIHGLFLILIAEFNDMAYCPFIHYFNIRVRIVGTRDRLPASLISSIEILEHSTQHYTRFYYQVAVGYGGRSEIVEAVNEIASEGKTITAHAIDKHSLCTKLGLPSVDFIVRTSERRTSGFFLWDTQAAELHFIDKLWPQLTKVDWINCLLEFSRRQIRGGA